MKAFAKWFKVKEAQRFDSANNNPSDNGSWARADLKSINAALDRNTRLESLKRARFVVGNNAYAYGAASAIVSAVAGTMPRLQLSAPDEDSATLTEIENAFAEWTDEINLADKLRQMRFAKFVDGETFAILFSNPKRIKTGISDKTVSLDVGVIDCLRVAASYKSSVDPHNYDGVIVDQFGAPLYYNILNYNPGDATITSAIDDASIFPAENVCHWFRRLYPEQVRGLSELSPALDLFNLIDRYSKAVVQASETAADLAMVFTTDGVDDDGAANIDDPPVIKPGDSPFVQLPWARGMTMTVPEGWDAKQIAAEQPSSSYSMLVDEILAQIGAAINVPKLLMKNSAENYNYSSARVDLQNFQNAVRLDRDSLRHAVLDPIWRAWYLEYRALNGLTFTPTATWYFDGFFHVDPQKEANAQVTRIQNGLSSLAAEYGARGKDWERELRQIAREKAFIKSLEKEYGVVISNDPVIYEEDTVDEE